jgi:hypothetical protein
MIPVRHVFRPSAVLIVALPVVAACSGGDMTTNQVTGSWASDGTQLSATSSSVVYVEPCLRAVFAPIPADSSVSFTLESTTLTITGNIQTTPETHLEIRGHFFGDTLQLQTRLIQLPIGVNDPLVTMLTPGVLKSVPVCTA